MRRADLCLTLCLLSLPALAGLRFQPAPGPSGALVHGLAEDGATLWAATQRGVWRYDAGAWTFDGLSDRTVRSVAVVAGDSVWAADGERVFRRGADGSWAGESLPSATAFPALVAADGATLYAGGLGLFRRAGGVWSQVSGLESGLVTALKVEGGFLWVGLSTGSVAAWNGSTFARFASGIGTGEEVTAVALVGTTPWAGTNKGLYQWTGASWQADAAFGAHDVRALSSAGGTLRAATEDAGVRRRSGSTWVAENAGLRPVAARAFAALGPDVYLGTNGGPVYRLQGTQWTEAGTLNAAVISDILSGLRDRPDSGDLWVASRGGGLFARGVTPTAPPLAGQVPDGCGDVSALGHSTAASGAEVIASTPCGPLRSFVTWVPVSDGLPTGSLLTSLASTSQGTFGGTAGSGVYRFTGSSWSADNAGLSATGFVSAVRSLPAGLFAALREGVFLRGSGTVGWADVSSGLPSGATVSALGGGDLLFAGLAAGGVYRRDGGAGFRRDSFGIATATVSSLELAGGRLVAGAGTSGVLVKRNGGFAPEGSGLPAGADVRVVRESRWSAAPQPESRDVLYAGTGGHGLFVAPIVPLVKTVPVLLDVTGGTGARFRSELVLGNRGSSAAEVALTFTPAQGFGGPETPPSTGTVRVPAGGEVRAPDALDLLRQAGIKVPAPPVAGSLSLKASDGGSTEQLYAVARTSTAAGTGGSYGLFYDGVSDLDAAEEEATVYGLRSVAGVSRSNLALVHVPGRGGKAIGLSVQVFSDRGVAAGAPIAVTLESGQWTQLNGVLSLGGLPEGSFGYARVTRVEGDGAWIAYGVVNDAVTSDGSYLPMFRPGGLAAARRLIVPVVLDVLGVGGAHFTTELTLVNDSPIATPVDIVYRPAPGFGSAPGVPVVTIPSIGARSQMTIPDVIQFLRQNGVNVPDPAEAGSQAGTLSVDFRFLQNLDTPRTLALARTSTPGAAGGSYGLFYPAAARGGGARDRALVPGLAQDESVRSNLAVVHLGGGSELPLELTVQLYDAETGAPAGASLTATLLPGDWLQWSRVLELTGAAPSVRRAVAVVTRTAGDDTFLAYGVTNDAATSDGSYVGMISSGGY